jgi:hypothetical protein
MSVGKSLAPSCLPRLSYKEIANDLSYFAFELRPLGDCPETGRTSFLFEL